MLRTLDHVILAVRDLDEATPTWARLLGRSPSWRGEHPAAGTANSLFRLDDAYVELLAPEGDGPVGRQLAARLEAPGEGLVGLAFGVDDADACHAYFAERGLAPGPVEKGMGRDVESGAFREWRRVPLPLSSTRGVVLFAVEHVSPDAVLSPAVPLGDEAASVSGVDHAVVRTRDPDACKALYGAGLGLRLALDKVFPQWGARMLFFRVGGVTVEVAAALDDSAADDTGRDQLWGLSLRVGSADRARRRLAELGLDVSDVREGRKPGTKVFSVRDRTCGVPVLMLEPPGSLGEKNAD